AKISLSLFSPGATMASIIANEYAEADSDLHLASMIYVGLILFLITLVVNGASRFIVWKFEKARGK
ncbi:MAG: phosphate ABC transporter permease subunit PstC, partial [Bacteriovoracaceae bacterium]